MLQEVVPDEKDTIKVVMIVSNDVYPVKYLFVHLSSLFMDLYSDSHESISVLFVFCFQFVLSGLVRISSY